MKESKPLCLEEPYRIFEVGSVFDVIKNLLELLNGHTFEKNIIS